MPLPLDRNLRICVQRLLKGEYRSDDFAELFLALRSRPKKTEIVAEIGNFTAHRDERDGGRVTSVLKNTMSLSKFHFECHEARYEGRKDLDPQRLPKATPLILEASFHALKGRQIVSICGLKPKDARPILESLIAKIAVNDDETCRFAATPSKMERKLFLGLLGTVNYRPAFTADELLRDFITALRQNNLLEDGERRIAKELRAPLAIYAITKLHQTRIKLLDGTYGNLTAHGAGGALSVVGQTVVGFMKNGQILMAHDIFSSGLRVADYCEGDLAICDDQTQWDELPLELLPSGRLAVKSA